MSYFLAIYGCANVHELSGHRMNAASKKQAINKSTRMRNICKAATTRDRCCLTNANHDYCIEPRRHKTDL